MLYDLTVNKRGASNDLSPYLVRPSETEFTIIAGDFSHFVLCCKFHKGWDCQIYTEHGTFFLVISFCEMAYTDLTSN